MEQAIVIFILRYKGRLLLRRQFHIDPKFARWLKERYATD
jgi:hypothetical protein